MQGLDHVNILKLHCVYNTQKRVILSTEYCGDITLQAFLKSSNNMLKSPRIKGIFASLLQAVAYCHSKGVSHRDIKLDNVLINPEGVVKLIDFGFANKRSLSTDKISDFCGTPSYMSPEIVQRQPYDGHKADIWALGVMLYRLLNGRYPFKGSSDNELFSSIMYSEPQFAVDVPQSARLMVCRMLEKKAVNRPTAEEILGCQWLKE